MIGQILKRRKEIKVGFSDFSMDEFKDGFSVEAICRALDAVRLKFDYQTPPDTLDRLNEILRIPDLYERLLPFRGEDLADRIGKKEELHALFVQTRSYRNRSFQALDYTRQLYIRRFNRLILETLNPETCPQKSNTQTIALDWIESIFVAFILAMFIRTFFFQAFRIPSGSMRMTLIEGDKLLVNKLYYGPKVPGLFFGGKIPFTHMTRLPGFRKPERGDVIVFIYPVDPKKDFIKRVVAVGGETVEIRQGNIYINGQKVDHPVMNNVYYYNKSFSTYGREGEVVRVPEGYYFVLGDNSASSQDSRFWGFVPEQNIIGKADIIYWPLDRIRFVK